MSNDIKVPGFQSSELIADLQSGFAQTSDSERQDLIKKTNGIFELQVTKDGQTATWTIDAKKTGTVYKGKASPKADVIIILADNILTDLANGKLNAQKAFIAGKLKTRGNIMLATKLENILKTATAKTKAKL